MKYVAPALMVLALAACDIFEPYEQPAAPPVASNWNNPLDAGDSQAKNWPDATWWESFNADELNGFIVEALHANDDLAIAVAHMREANANVTIAGAPLLPNLELDANGSRSIALNKRSPNDPAHGKSVSAALNASYELDFWGKNRSAAESAQALADATEFDHQTVVLSVTSSVATTYFDWLASNERVRIAQQNIAASQKIVEAIRARFQAGTVSRLDLEQQENLVANQQAALPPLQLKATQDMNALAVLLGRMPESMPQATGDFTKLDVPKVPPGLPSELLTRRPDIASAEANLRAAHADVNNARAQFFPDISLTAGLGNASTGLNDLFSTHNTLLSLGAGAIQPIFEGGLLSGQLDYNHAFEEELTANYHKSIISAFSDVENALTAYTRNKEQDEAQQASEMHARAAFDLSQRQFDAGIIDITTLLNVQQNFFTASDARLQTRVNYLSSAVNLYVALGGGWQMAEKK